MTSLAFLSIARVGHSFWRQRKVPHVPTATERMQAYNATRPIQFANTLLPQPSPGTTPTPPAGRRLSNSEDRA